MTQADIVTRVVKAVAAVDGVDTAELDPLYEYIDLGTLKRLYAQEKGEWSFTFQYSDHQITVTHDARIFVDGNLHAPEVSSRESTDR